MGALSRSSVGEAGEWRLSQSGCGGECRAAAGDEEAEKEGVKATRAYNGVKNAQKALKKAAERRPLRVKCGELCSPHYE